MRTWECNLKVSALPVRPPTRRNLTPMAPLLVGGGVYVRGGFLPMWSL